MVNITTDSFTEKKMGKSGQIEYLINNRFSLQRLVDEMFKNKNDKKEFQQYALSNPFITMLYLKQYKMDNFEKTDEILDKMKRRRGQIFMVTGKKRSGKSTLCWTLCDNLHEKGERIWYFGPPTKLPHFVEGTTMKFENLPANVTVFIGEAGVQFYNKGSVKDKINIMKQLPILAHNGRNIIYEVHNSSMVTKDIFRLTDSILFKSYSPFQFETERFTISDELKNFMPTKVEECLYYDNDGILSFSFNLPRWWKDEYSNPYAMFKTKADMYRFMVNLSKECGAEEIKNFLSLKSKHMEIIEVERILMIIKNEGLEEMLSWKDEKIVEIISKGFDDTSINDIAKGNFKRIKCDFEMTNIQSDYWKEIFAQNPEKYLASQLNYNESLLQDLRTRTSKVQNVNIFIKGDPTNPLGSGKSFTALSIAEVIEYLSGNKFNIDYVFFDAEKLLSSLKDLKPNTVVVFDDETRRAGIGSGRIIEELKNVEQTFRKKRIHFIFTSPEDRFSHISNFVLRTYGIDEEKNIARLLVYSPDERVLYGYVTFKKPRESIIKPYEAKKDEFLLKIAERSTSDKDWKTKAEKLIQHPLWVKAKNHRQKLALCGEVFSNIGSSEAEMVVSRAEMME